MKSKKIILYVLVMVGLLLSISLTYSWFNTKIENLNSKKQIVTTRSIKLTFEDNDEVSMNGMMPGKTISKTFTVRNTGVETVNFNLIWETLENTVQNDELVMEIRCTRLNSNDVEEGACAGLSKTPINDEKIKKGISISPGVSYKYDVVITFIDTNEVQDYNFDSTFLGRFGIEEYKSTSYVEPVYCTYVGDLTQGTEYVNGQYTYRYMQVVDLEKIDFTDSNIDGWSVMLSNLEDTAPATSTICSYINGKPVVSINAMFFQSKASKIDLSSLDTSNVTEMGLMFLGTQATEIIGLDTFNTTGVTTMYAMFEGCQVSSLDLSNFDTNNVIDMSYMFGQCVNLKTIYVGDKFITNNVIKDENMFIESTSLIGGNGTKYDNSYVGRTYARIDIEGMPGYFTFKSK